MLKSTLIAAALSLVSIPSFAASVSDLTTDPLSPVTLDFGDRVTISFDYDMMGESGRIFARPFTDGNLTPGYGASGSGVYTGIGQETGAFFTINTAAAGYVTVDQIRVQILNVDQSILFSEQFFDADITFGEKPVSTVPLPASLLLLGFGLGGLGIASRKKTKNL